MFVAPQATHANKVWVVKTGKIFSFVKIFLSVYFNFICLFFLLGHKYIKSMNILANVIILYKHFNAVFIFCCESARSLSFVYSIYTCFYLLLLEHIKQNIVLKTATHFLGSRQFQRVSRWRDNYYFIPMHSKRGKILMPSMWCDAYDWDVK